MESDLVDSEFFPESREKPDKGLANGPGADDVDDAAHVELLTKARGPHTREAGPV